MTAEASIRSAPAETVHPDPRRSIPVTAEFLRTAPPGSVLSIAATRSAIPPRSARNMPVSARGDSTEAARDAAALARRLHQPGKHRAHRQPLDVARMDAAEQRLGDEVDGGGAESSPEERRHGFVFGRRLWNERLERHTHPRRPVQQVVSPQRRE